MSPHEPPRRKGSTITDQVAPGAVHSHTPVPPPLPLRDAVSTAPPPAMPMAPPRGMQGPRTHQRQHSGQPDERTLVGIAPPPRDEMDSRDISIESLLAEHKLEADARRAAERELAELRRMPRVEVAPLPDNAVHIRYGKLKLALPVVLFAGLASGGTYLVARNTDATRPPADDVLNEVRALKTAVEKRNNDQDLRDGFILQRVGTLETQNGVAQAQLAAILAQLRQR